MISSRVCFCPNSPLSISLSCMSTYNREKFIKALVASFLIDPSLFLHVHNDNHKTSDEFEN